MVLCTTSVAVPLVVATPVATGAGTTVRPPVPVSQRGTPPGSPVASIPFEGTPPAASSAGEYLIKAGFLTRLFEGFKVRVQPGMKILRFFRFEIGSSLPIRHLSHIQFQEFCRRNP